MATLIFASGHGSAISSAKERKSGFTYNLVELVCWMCAYFKEIVTVSTLNSHLLTLKVHITTSHLLLSSAEMFLNPLSYTV